MRFRVRVDVELREGLVDPEGESVRAALADLGLPVASARAGKHYELVVEADGAEGARAVAARACELLLANPVKDSCRVEVEALEG